MKNKENEKNEKNEKIAVLYFIAAVCFYVTSIICFIGRKSGTAVVFMCLGSANLCLGGVYLDKKNKDDKKNNTRSQL